MKVNDDMAFSYAKPAGVPKVLKMREEKAEPKPEPKKRPVRKRRKTKRKRK